MSCVLPSYDIFFCVRNIVKKFYFLIKNIVTNLKVTTCIKYIQL